MSTYDLEEQEQLAALKAWWKRYGNLVLTTVTVALLAIAAWNGWRWYQHWTSAQAAAHYETLQQAARAGDAKAARDAAGAILEKFSGTAYAPLAALVSAKVHLQSGDPKTARAQLEWAVANAGEELRAIARLRLASLLTDEGAFDLALTTLASPPASFASLFAEARGDVLLAQKKPVEAKAAYREAIERAERGDAGRRDGIQLKLDALGGQ